MKEIKRALDIAKKACVESGKYAKSRKNKIRRVSFKGEINLVTDVDKSCQDKIVRIIRNNFPSHNILSEENYETKKDSDYKWVIDPLDGTTNFAHGLPIYSTSIALEKNGDIIAGAVYNPELDELFYACRNKGSFLNNKRIRVSKIRSVKKSLLVTGFAYNIKKKAGDNIGNFETFLKKAQAVRRLGSAALDLCYVASGRFDGFWELGLHPWDSAAGLLIIEEAGGKVTKFDNSPYSIYDKEILATNSSIHPDMVKALK